MLDFGALPPEINSAAHVHRPRAGSMLAAAAAWKSWPPSYLRAAWYCSVISA